MGQRTRRRRLLAATTAVLAVGALALAPSAFAQTASSDDGTLQIREVDARDAAATAATFGWSGDPAAVEGLTVEDDGDEVASEPATRLDQQVAMVLSVDTSQAMNGAALVEAKAALAQMVENRPENSVVALVSFAEQPVVEQDFTNDDARLLAAIDALAASGPTALWNGVGTAAQLFDGAPIGAEHDMVLISGGADQGSTTTPSRARGEVDDADASVYAVGVGAADVGALQALVASAGGVFTASDPDDIADALVTANALLAQQYQVVWNRGEEPSNAADLTLQIGETSAEASFIDGGVMAGAQLTPREAAEPSGYTTLQTEPFKLLAVVGVLLAVTLGFYALVTAVAKDPSGLETVLSPYGEGYVPGGSADVDDEDTSLAKSAILQRAVDLTEQIAEKQGFLATAETQLERANLPLRAAEAMFFYAAFVLITFLLVSMLVGVFVGAIVAVATALLGPAIVNFLAKRRRKQFVGQLPDMLALLSGTLRAGYSLMQGVEAVAQEVDEPMGFELRRVCTEARLGRPLEEALDASAERLQIPDYSWAIMAIRIQREVGGNLAELLMTVGDTMTQRERLRRDVAALTAEGKMSAIVLGVLPPALAAVMWVVNPTYIGVLFSTTAGNFMLGFATVLALFGFWWMKKTIEIEI
jgi:tight adherence protein B